MRRAAARNDLIEVVEVERAIGAILKIHCFGEACQRHGLHGLWHVGRAGLKRAPRSHLRRWSDNLSRRLRRLGPHRLCAALGRVIARSESLQRGLDPFARRADRLLVGCARKGQGT